MTEPIKDAVETTVEGKDEKTPVFAFTGVTIAIGVVVAVLIVVLLVLYYAFGGK